MNLATFDLYWKTNTDNHWINQYYEIFFDWKKLQYNSKISKEININWLTNVLNQVDYRACHNFAWYDWAKLPLLSSHSEKNIDTLLIDSLLNFDKSHHNLKKSEKNNPLEDAASTFKVLENNLITFKNLNSYVKNILYSLLIEYEAYNDFFIFYNRLNNNELILFNNEEIKENINKFLIKKWILENNFEFDIFFKNNNSKLALSYLILFLEKQKIVLPDFLYKENLELRKILRDNLSDFYKIFENYFNDNIKHFLKEFYNFKDFRWTTQSKWVKCSLENKDILTILSTWWGKSLIYQLPARIIWEKLGHLSLVITPLKALIKDQIDWLNKKWFNEVKYFSWDQSNLEKQIIREKIKSWETKLLFLTPESLRNENNFEFLKNRYISRIIIDEAHTLILWGWEFRPDYFFIKTFLEDLEKQNLNKKINITLLTATAPIDVEKWLKSYFNNRVFEIIKQENTLKENIKPSVINIENKENKIEKLVQKIKEINISENPTIIFTSSIDSTTELKKHLEEDWIKSEAFYWWDTDKSKKIPIFKKKEIQNAFISWKLNLIIATKAFWMWIDKENVRYVIHYDLPWNIEDYLQEIWRAGRDWKLSKNIIFYEKKDIEKRLKLVNNSDIKNFHITSFINYIDLKKKLKISLSPRQIANKTYIKTNKKNYITNIKILLSFLEREKIFKWQNILERKYDSTLVLFNKIEEKNKNDYLKIIEKYPLLNNETKSLLKQITNHIIEEKKSIDLNKIEENFWKALGNNFNYKNINKDLIEKSIKSLKILWKAKNNTESDLVIEAGFILKSWNYFWDEEDKYQKIFNIIWKNLKNNFKEAENNFYNKIKNYYLFKNFIKEKNWKIIIKNNNLIKHFEKISNIWKIILSYIFDDDKKYLENQILNISDLLKYLQNNYKQDLWISELKEVLYFLHMLEIIKVKNGLLVLLTRYNLEFNENIFELKEKLEDKDFKKVFELDIRAKLGKYIEMKKNKLLALQLIVENLEKKWVVEYTNLAKYYFNHSLKEFSDNFIKIKRDKYKEYLLK